MEKWLVVLGVWGMCAVCAVLFIRGATGASNRSPADKERAPAASRASAGDTQAAVND